jgi:hypothetical protein
MEGNMSFKNSNLSGAFVEIVTADDALLSTFISSISFIALKRYGINSQFRPTFCKALRMI